MAENNCLVVVAIDFGTTYSGYAFQFRHEYKSVDPTTICAPQSWSDGKAKVSSMKTPTCLLLDKDRNIDSFGFEAERKFVDACLDGEDDQFYYFKRFKMKLHDVQSLSPSTMLRSENKKELPALEVFAKSIKCLKMKLKEDLNVNRASDIVKDEEIFYILTVPAIWNDNAKQFMRQAAIDAGIDTKRLAISLEPECASLYSQYLPVHRFVDGGKSLCRLTKPGTIYMIVDLGGGTADITVHEKQEGGKLREVHQACGGPWGGVMVDSFFIQMLSNIVSPLAMSEFMKEKPGDYHELIRDFEHLKRKVDTTSDTSLNIKLPPSLNEYCQKHRKMSFEEALKESDDESRLTVVRDKLKIKAVAAKRLFEKVTEKLLPTLDQCIEDVSKKEAPKKISLILMVGGFSESLYMQETIKERYNDVDGMKVLIPDEAGLMVLKGAVVFGRQPSSITSRVLRYTYGAEVTPPFDPAIHDESMRTKDGKRCMNVFKPFMGKGTEVKQGHVLKTIYHTTAPMQKTITLKIFVTDGQGVKYTTDPACRYLGTLTMTLNNPTQQLQDLSVTYIFGETEIKVIGIEELSGHKCEAVIKMNDT